MGILKTTLLLFLALIVDSCDSISPAYALRFSRVSVPVLARKAHAPEPLSAPARPPFTYDAPTRGIKAAYWPSFNDFTASAINTSYFTHVYYAFLLLSPTTYELDVSTFDQEKLPEFMDAIRDKDPPVKTMLSIGGGGGGKIPIVISEMTSEKSRRATFINSTIEVARQYGFDGLDMDWEFPVNNSEMSNLGLLFKEWRMALDDEANVTKKDRLLLTSAVYYGSNITFFGEPRSYPAEAISKFADWVSPMCFGYYGSWNDVTGEEAALYDPNSALTTDFGIQSWIQAGVPPEKIVMGLPLYGPTWTLANPNVNGVGAPTVGSGPGGGLFTYSAVVDFNMENNATVTFDKDRVAYYSYVGDSWISYDDVESVELKVQYAQALNLGGYFFWALGQDKDWTISNAASQAWKN